MYPASMPVYRISEIRDLETQAMEHFGITGATMMQRAGKAAFDFLSRRWPQAKRIAVFCGGGNNGGDGYVLAKLALERGLDVTIYQVGETTRLSDEARDALTACQQMNMQVDAFHAAIDLRHPDVIVDAICGIGLKTAPAGEIADAIKKIERQQLPVLSIDVPTGVNADTGSVPGLAIHATATMTFVGLKLGLITGPGTSYTGELVFSDLQLPPDIFFSVKSAAEKMHPSLFSTYLKPRLREWHKQLSGHVLVIGGDKGYSGAARMAAEAALRVGAGLVSVATQPEHAATMNVLRPEIMCHGVTDAAQLAPLLEKADVIVLGPGLGQSAWAQGLWKQAVSSTLPLLIDADGLTLLSHTTQRSNNWILTPHAGEAGRLLGKPASEVQDNRLEAAQEINARYGGVCVLKGAGTLVTAENSQPSICDKGNPGMATAGMGDVLSGVIGGLLAQGIPLKEAATLGVYLHAMAGDLAAKEGERGMIATDLLPFLRRLVN